MRPVNDHQCPVYRPFIEIHDNSSADTGLVRGVRSRSDYDYARKLIGIPASSVEIDAWSASGWCEKPAIESFVSLTCCLSAPFELTTALVL
jgi:mannosidase alpha-like ER degradation enhancer 1